MSKQYIFGLIVIALIIAPIVQALESNTFIVLIQGKKVADAKAAADERATTLWGSRNWQPSNNGIFWGANSGQTNLAPRAVAESSYDFLTQTAFLDANASTDENGDPLQYTWKQVGGPAATLDVVTPARVTFRAPQLNSPTSYVFQLTVTDQDAQKSTAITTLAVPAQA